MKYPMVASAAIINNPSKIINQKAKVLLPFLYMMTKTTWRMNSNSPKTKKLMTICSSPTDLLNRNTDTNTRIMTIILINSEGCESLLFLIGFIKNI